MQRFLIGVLPCYVSSSGQGPSHTAIGSVIRLLAVTFAAVAGKLAPQRAEIVPDIQEELQDTDA